MAQSPFNTGAHTMQTNKEFILTHIEASTPCSLYSVACWAHDQLDINAASFMYNIDTLVSEGKITVSSDDIGLIVDLI